MHKHEHAAYHMHTQITVEADERIGPILPEIVLDGGAQKRNSRDV